MKRIILFLFLFVALIDAQVTTSFTLTKQGSNTICVLWKFTQITDTISVFYSPKFSSAPSIQPAQGTSLSWPEIMGDYGYYALAGACSQFTMKQTKSTAVPNTAVIFQGLYNSASDTSTVATLRAAHVVQTTGDTSATFTFRRVGSDYRLKLTNTGGRITSGFISLIFTKPDALKP